MPSIAYFSKTHNVILALTNTSLITWITTTWPWRGASDIDHPTSVAVGWLAAVNQPVEEVPAEMVPAEIPLLVWDRDHFPE